MIFSEQGIPFQELRNGKALLVGTIGPGQVVHTTFFDLSFFGTPRRSSIVAFGLMHGLYLQQWQSHIFTANESICDHRHQFQQVLLSD
jgi:hypothetical protein